MPNPISQPTYPSNMTEADLGFSKLMDVLIADFVYFGIGTYDAASIDTLYATQAAVKLVAGMMVMVVGAGLGHPVILGGAAGQSNPLRGWQAPGAVLSLPDFSPESNE